jgi:beta-phosphoglucomutase-like phosphatase (HAD superfamily)
MGYPTSVTLNGFQPTLSNISWNGRPVVHAVILDIDGTLLESNEADDELYVTAVRSVLGPVRLRESWDRYDHVTDSGILADICADNGLVLARDDLEQIKTRFIGSLAQHIDGAGAFAEIPGARDFVLSLHNSNQHAVAYATGGWGASARLKLSSAGFPLDIPLASSDDFPERTSIMKHALALIGHEVLSITYYGDGSWDQVATRRLGWQFVAVGDTLAGLSKYEVVGADGGETRT